jgi:hypothetical protein
MSMLILGYTLGRVMFDDVSALISIGGEIYLNHYLSKSLDNIQPCLL